MVGSDRISSVSEDVYVGTINILQGQLDSSGCFPKPSECIMKECTNGNTPLYIRFIRRNFKVAFPKDSDLALAVYHSSPRTKQSVGSAPALFVHWIKRDEESVLRLLSRGMEDRNSPLQITATLNRVTDQSSNLGCEWNTVGFVIVYWVPSFFHPTVKFVTHGVVFHVGPSLVWKGPTGSTIQRLATFNSGEL
jgi:hypothetical protein